MIASVAIGIFAHQEEDNISSIISYYEKQSIINNPDFYTKIYILANGCSDKTVQIARECIKKSCLLNIFEIIEIDKGGKSNAWNVYVHDVCKDQFDYLLFCDADIRVIDESVIETMITVLINSDHVDALNSMPVKDINYDLRAKGFVQKIIASSSGGFSDWKSSICGQLYGVKYKKIKDVYMPIGLPVEDGFIGAVIATENFTQPPDNSKIFGVEKVWHVYESEKKISSIIRHQVRIVVGSAINYAVFTHFNKIGIDKAHAIQKISANDETWLPCLINSFYPRKWGWVPIHFLIKRVSNISLRERLFLNLIKMFIGFSFDLVVYFKAQIVMLKGRGPGYW